MEKSAIKKVKQLFFGFFSGLDGQLGLILLSLAAVGFFIYTEQYNVKQIFGIFLTIVGLFLISCKN